MSEPQRRRGIGAAAGVGLATTGLGVGAAGLGFAALLMIVCVDRSGSAAASGADAAAASGADAAGAAPASAAGPAPGAVADVAVGAAPGSAWLDHVSWVNHAPIHESDLRGHVVVVEFWTFGCVNCMRTVPAMRALEAAVGKRGVVVLGLHSPEFDRERSRANVTEAVGRLGLKFPVAQDNDYAAWRAFDNQYWPALYVLDPRGRVRATHIGELHLGTPEWGALLATIRDLSREAG